MKAAGLNVPLMGGDGIYDPKYIKLAGATSRRRPRHLGRRPDRHARRRQEVRRRLQGGRLRGALAAYGGYSYDAANAIINGAEDPRSPAPTRRRVGPPGHDRRDGQGLVRRRHRQGRVRPVRRHHDQGPDRLQGQGRQVGGRQDRGLRVQATSVTSTRRRRGWSDRPPPPCCLGGRSPRAGNAAPDAVGMRDTAPRSRYAPLSLSTVNSGGRAWTPSPSSSSTG